MKKFQTADITTYIFTAIFAILLAAGCSKPVAPTQPEPEVMPRAAKFAATLDPDEDLGDITNVTSVQQISGTIQGAGTQYYYRLMISENRKVIIHLREQDANADLFLENVDGEVIVSKVKPGTANETISGRTLLAGTYYARIEAKEDARNDYILRYKTSDPNPAAIERLLAALAAQEPAPVPPPTVTYTGDDQEPESAQSHTSTTNSPTYEGGNTIVLGAATDLNHNTDSRNHRWENFYDVRENTDRVKVVGLPKGCRGAFGLSERQVPGGDGFYRDHAPPVLSNQPSYSLFGKLKKELRDINGNDDGANVLYWVGDGDVSTLFFQIEDGNESCDSNVGIYRGAASSQQTKKGRYHTTVRTWGIRNLDNDGNQVGSTMYYEKDDAGEYVIANDERVRIYTYERTGHKGYITFSKVQD